MARLRIELVKSIIGRKPNHIATAKSLRAAAVPGQGNGVAAQGLAAASGWRRAQAQAQVAARCHLGGQHVGAFQQVRPVGAGLHGHDGFNRPVMQGAQVHGGGCFPVFVICSQAGRRHAAKRGKAPGAALFAPTARL